MEEKPGVSAPPPAYNQATAGPASYPPGPAQGFAPPPQGYAPPPQGYAPPPQGYAPPPQGYGQPPQGFAQPAPQPITVNVAQAQASATSASVGVVRGTGNCPNCGNGRIIEDFTVCGIILAVLFFPLGVLCCLLMRRRYCNLCGYTVG